MPLIQLLADGGVHSGEDLGAAMGISRAAVWKQLKKLESIGLQVESVKGVGHRLVKAIDLLDHHALQGALSGIAGVSIFNSIDSTNAHVGQVLRAGLDASATFLCAAEMQTAGRGRRGRAWVSPFAGNLYFSYGFTTARGVACYEGLSLAVGVEIVGVLTRLLGDVGFSLKWPNDILFDGRKLGGILIEVDGDFAGACNLVVGVGINHHMPADDGAVIDQPWVDLQQIARSAGQVLPSRTVLLVEFAKALAKLAEVYPEAGFKSYRQAWQNLDCHRDQPVSVHTGVTTTQGIALGVDDQGALRLLADGEEQIFSGGEVSLRSSE